MKNMKKLLLSLLLVPSLALTGCDKDNDTSNNNNQSSEQGGSGSGSESGGGSESGSSTPAGLTDAQKEAAYGTLYSLNQKILNKTNKTMNYVTDSKSSMKMTLGENEELDPEEAEQYETVLESMEESEKTRTTEGYNIDDETFYYVYAEYNSETEQYEINNASYLKKNGTTLTRYEDKIESSSEEEPEMKHYAYIVGEGHFDKEFFVPCVLGNEKFIGMIKNSPTLAEFKQLIITLIVDEVGIAQNDVTFEITLNEGVYSIKAIVANKPLEYFDYDMGGMPMDAILNATIEFKFDTTKIISWSTAMSMTADTAMPLSSDPEADPVNVRITLEQFSSIAFETTLDSELSTKDFSAYEAQGNYKPSTGLYLNGVRVDSISMPFDTELGTDEKQQIEEQFGYQIKDLLDGIYLDEGCTEDYSNLQKWLSYDFNLYSTIDETAVEDGTAVVIFDHYNTEYDFHFDGEAVVITLSDLTDNKLVLDEYLYEYSTLEEVLVDGVATTGDITLENKQVVVITLNYVQPAE